MYFGANARTTRRHGHRYRIESQLSNLSEILPLNSAPMRHSKGLACAEIRYCATYLCQVSIRLESHSQWYVWDSSTVIQPPKMFAYYILLWCDKIESWGAAPSGSRQRISTWEVYNNLPSLKMWVKLFLWALSHEIFGCPRPAFSFRLLWEPSLGTISVHPLRFIDTNFVAAKCYITESTEFLINGSKRSKNRMENPSASGWDISTSFDGCCLSDCQSDRPQRNDHSDWVGFIFREILVKSWTNIPANTRDNGKRLHDALCIAISFKNDQQAQQQEHETFRGYTEDTECFQLTMVSPGPNARPDNAKDALGKEIWPGGLPSENFVHDWEWVESFSYFISLPHYVSICV